MIIEEDIYLEHFGVKGMHWGVRKSQNHPDVGNSKRSPKAPEQKMSNKKKAAIATAVGIGAAIAVGTVYAARTQKISNLKSIPTFKKTSRNGAKAANKVLKTNGDLKVRALAARKAAVSDKTTLKGVATRHLRSVNDTNVKLKNWYNQGNVPIPKREFLDTKYWERLAG